jgi:hypothetical protein
MAATLTRRASDTCGAGDLVACQLTAARDAFLAAALRSRDLNGQLPWHARKALAQRLQIALRLWIPQHYFSTLERFWDRPAAFPVIVYAASQIWYPKLLQLTFDAGEFALKHAVNNIGTNLASILAPLSERMYQAATSRAATEGSGPNDPDSATLFPSEPPADEAVSRALLDLSHRYDPAWREDILRAVLRRPRPFIRLLSGEARLINALDRFASIQPALTARCSSYSLRLAAAANRHRLSQASAQARYLGDFEAANSSRRPGRPPGLRRVDPLHRFDTDLARALRFFPALPCGAGNHAGTPALELASISDFRGGISRFALEYATSVLLENPFDPAHPPPRIRSRDRTEN